MELAKILRELSRRKALVAGVVAFSMLVGFLLAFQPSMPPKSRQFEVALASSDILVDTRNSQVVAVGRKGPDLPTLAGRANLMGNLMTSGTLKEDIAKRAGVPAGKLIVVPPADPSTPWLTPVPVKPRGALEVPPSEQTVLTLSTDESLPILHVEAQAPQLNTARHISSAALFELSRYLSRVAASQDVPVNNQLVVRAFGAPTSGFVIRGLPRRYALVATIFLLLAGCAAILGWAWLVRNWRATGLEVSHDSDEGHDSDESGDEEDDGDRIEQDRPPLKVLRS